MGKLKDKVAIVTGAGHGIGRAAARRLAEEGAAVLLAEISDELGAETERAFRAAGLAVAYVHTDVSKLADIRRAIQTAIDDYGRLDILVNNAQYAAPGRVTDISEAEWERSIATSLTSVFRACKHAIPHMQRQGGGAIVSVSSIYGLVGGRRRPAYNATKAAIINLTRNMALDYAADNIRVNCVCPGAVTTWPAGKPPAAFAWTVRRYPEPLNPEQRALQHPIGRQGRPEEIAEAILFLVDPANSFMTGAALVVDGGLTAQALL